MIASSSAPDVIDDDGWIIHLCLRSAALSSLLFSGVTGHSCESVDVTHSWTSTKGLLCVWNGGWSPSLRQLGQYWNPCGLWGGVSVWRRGGQGEDQLCRLLCSVWFETLNRNRQLWGTFTLTSTHFPSICLAQLPIYSYTIVGLFSSSVL